MAVLSYKKALRLFSDYIRERNWTAATEKGYLYRLNCFFGYLAAKGIFDLRDVSKKDIAAYADHLGRARRIKDRRRFKEGTKEAYFLVLKSLFKFLVRNEWILADPTSGVELLANEVQELPDFLSEKEMERVLKLPNVNTASGLRNRAILEVFYGTGIRKSELLHLKTTDVSFEESLLFIDQGKGMKDRIVPLGDVSRHFLRQYMEKARKRLMSRGARNNALFVTYFGKGFSENGLNKILEKYLKLAGIKRQISVHSLRHTFAVHMLKNGTDIRYIQEILGHSSYHTSFHYTRVLTEHLKVMYKEHHPFENQLFEDVEKANSKYLEKIEDAISKGRGLW